MQRRTFLETSLLGASAIATGCGSAPVRPALDARASAALIERLQRGLRELDDQPVGVYAQRFPAHPRPDLAEQVFRLTLQSLLVADVVRELPEDQPMPAPLAEALAPLAPQLARCLHTQHALLTRMPAAQRHRLDRRMRTQPNAPMELAEWVDAHAARLGVPLAQRTSLRNAALTTTTRIRRQSVNAVIEDVVSKVDLAIARHDQPPPEALARRTERIVDAMWRQVGDDASALAVPVPPPSYTSATSTGPSAPLTSAPITTTLPPSAGGPIADASVTRVPERFGSPGEMDDPTEPVQWSEQWAHPGDEERRIGGIMMPFGILSCGLFLIIGLIVFIAGSVQNGDWDGRTHAGD